MIKEKQYADVALIDRLNAEAWDLRETDMRKSYDIANKAFHLASAKNYKKGLAESQRTIGISALSLALYAESYEKALHACSLFRETGDKINEAITLNTLGGIYDYLGDIDNRLQANLRSLQLRKEAGDEEGYVRSLNNTGDTYIKLGDYDKALALFTECLEKIGDRPRMEAIVLCNIGEVYLLNKRYAEAKTTIEKSLIAGRATDYHPIVVADLMMLARMELVSNNNAQAIELLEQARVLAEKVNVKADLAETHRMFAEAYSNMGDHKKAFEHHCTFFAIREQVVSEKKLLEMRNIQFRHESENLQKAAQKLEQQVNDRTRELNTAYMELKKSEEEQRFNLEIEMAINYFSVSLFNPNTVDEVLWDLAKNCISRLNFVDCVVYLKDKSGKRLIQKAAYGIKNPKDYEIYNPIEVEIGKGIVGSVAASGVAEIIADTSTDKRYIVDDEARLSEIAIPIKSGSEVFGVIDSEHPDKGFFTERHQRILTTIASLCANKIERIRTVETRARLANELIEQLKKNEHLQTQVNRELEVKVVERTREIEDKKQQIEQQKKDITDSIAYARTIQEAMLPKYNDINQLLPEHFILYKPKDIVSGDFYWVAEKENLLFIAVADCTGHGVPGALMSVMGITKLEQAAEQSSEPGEILRLLNLGMKKALKQSDTLSSSNDGMDIALICIDRAKMQVKFAGAHRPLWIAGNENLNEIKATRTSIGGKSPDDQQFVTTALDLHKGDVLYLFSDGYTDQFGGGKNKKFSRARLRDEVRNIMRHPLHRQKELLENTWLHWKNLNEQTDDVCLLGFRV